MSNAPKRVERKRLGRGLSALIGDLPDRPDSHTTSPVSLASRTESGVTLVPIGDIRANPNNPRRRFGDSELSDLSTSIAERGVVQPILVRPSSDGYELVAGERRWRATQKAGLHEIPVIIRDIDDRESLELAIIENVQRTDLNPIEEALGYKQLIDDHNYRQQDLSKIVGKSRSHIANMLRLLTLPDSIQRFVEDGKLSMGHARALVVSDSAELIARRVVSDGLSVRETERLVSGGSANTKQQRGKGGSSKDADTRALQKSVSDALGLKVSIDHKRGGDSGRLTVFYDTLDQLDDVMARLSKS